MVCNAAIKYLYENFQVNAPLLCHVLRRETRRILPWYSVFISVKLQENIWTGKQRKNATSTSKEGKNSSIHENFLT